MQSVIRSLLERPEQTVITATRRLSRRLLYEYNQRQQAGGLRTWATPDILTWQAWLQRQWALSVNDTQRQVLLTTAQTLQCWRDVIASDADTFINTRATAEKAQTARQWVFEYQLDLSADSVRRWFVYDADASRWLHWNRRYEHTLRDKSWLDLPAFTQTLIERIVSGQHAIAAPLCLLGFDALTVLQKQLQSWLMQHDYYVQISAENTPPGNAYLFMAKNPAHEIEQAAHWARTRFENHWREGDKPIAIIAPQLRQNRRQIERVLRQVFYPQDNLLSEQPLHTQGIRENAIFNLSLGYSLKQEPLVATVLKILALCRRIFRYEDFSHVLRSPFINDAAARRAAYSSLDFLLRKRMSAEISLRGLIAGLPGGQAHDWRTLLSHLSKLQKSWPRRASARFWADNFRQCLSLFGVLQAGDNYHQQVIRSLDDAWFEFARLELVGDDLSAGQAVSLLTQMINDTIFQPGAAELPVQVLGVIEAAGMTFSALWVMQMTQHNWPQQTRPNPFIPLHIQRQYDMPHCSPQHEFEYAERQTQRLLRAADNIVFSYPQYNDEEILAPSPLVADFPLMTAVSGATPADVLPPRMEELSDCQGPAVDVDNYHVGSSALQDQSACPFRAFITHRLHGVAPETPQFGNDPRVRGSLVHKVMEKLWQQWQTSAQLQALTDEQLQNVVMETIEQVVRTSPVNVNHQYEIDRLFNVIVAWLNEEKQRQAFSVQSNEQKISTEIEQLPLHLRIDRIDTLEDGGLCIVDYKTGKAKSSAWHGERPDEPQLPLYALAQTAPVSAVVFANIRAGEHGYNGVTKTRALMVADATDEKMLSGIKQIPATSGSAALQQYQDWDDILAQWRHTISRLAREHIAGEASVDPKKHPDTCQYCQVKPVCRLFGGMPAEASE